MRILSKNLLLAIIFSIVTYCIFISIPSHTHEVDEGWYAQIGSDLASGKTLYKDISAPYGPVSFYVYSFIIKYISNEFFVFRIFGLILILSQGFLIYYLYCKFSIAAKYKLLVFVLSLIPLTVYQGCRITASTIACTSIIINIICHINFTQDRKIIYLLIFAFNSFFLLLTKHNVFIFDMAGHITFIMYYSTISRFKEFKNTLKYCGIFILVFGALFICYYISIYDYKNIVLGDTILSIQKYKSSDITVPFPTPFDLVNMNTRDLFSALFLYAVFPLLGLIIINIKENNNYLRPENSITIVVLIQSVFHLGQIYPLSDYSHYSRATILLPLLLILNCNNIYKFTISKKWIFVSVFIILHYYTPAYNFTKSVFHAFTKSKSNLPHHNMIRFIDDEPSKSELLKRLKQDNIKQFLIIGHGNVLYYLTGNLTPTRFNLITSHYLNKDEENEVITIIKQKQIENIVVVPSVREHDELSQLTKLSEYISDFYIFRFEIDGYVVYAKDLNHSD